MFQQIIRNRPVGLAATAVIAAGLFAGHGQAQQIMITEARIGGDNSFEPAVSAPQMKRLSHVLSLNETQAALADEFLRDYHSIFREGAEAVRERMSVVQEEARATGDFSVFGEKIGPLLEEWGRERERLERDMIENLRSLLSEEQLESWPIFERERRRMEQLPDSRLGGEDVDVILLTHEVTTGGEFGQDIIERLDQYAIELDAALQARQRTIESLQEDWREALGGERERLEDIWNEATRKREAVRDINERYARQISELLKEGSGEVAAAGESLWRLYIERAYPMAFEDTRADRMIKGALELEALGDDERALVEGVQLELSQRLDAIGHRLIAELVKEEKELPPFAQNVRIEGGGGAGRAIGLTMTMSGDGEEQYGGLLRERWEASEAAVERLKAGLAPEQIAGISSREEPGTAQRMVMRGFRFNL